MMLNNNVHGLCRNLAKAINFTVLTDISTQFSSEMWCCSLIPTIWRNFLPPASEYSLSRCHFCSPWQLTAFSSSLNVLAPSSFLWLRLNTVWLVPEWVTAWQHHMWLAYKFPWIQHNYPLSGPSELIFYTFSFLLPSMSLPFPLFSFDTLAEHWFLSLAVRKWWECLGLINDCLKIHTSALYCSIPTFFIVAHWWPLWTDSTHFFPAFWFVTQVHLCSGRCNIQLLTCWVLYTLTHQLKLCTNLLPLFTFPGKYFLSIFSPSNTFLLTLFPCCAPSILTLPFPTGSLAVLFSFLLPLNLYPDFPSIFVCYPEDTGSRLLKKICKFLSDCRVSHPRREHSS